MKIVTTLLLAVMSMLVVSCSYPNKSDKPIKADTNGIMQLSDSDIEHLVKVSYQYVAMYNVNNKFAMGQGGWNTIVSDTKAKDHTLTDIARPNNDSYYTTIMLDLRTEPFVITLPQLNSDYVSLMVTPYDHYVMIPKSTRMGDFSKPEKLLIYSDRTAGYSGEPIEGIDDTFKTSGDFISAVFRTMPHMNEKERYETILKGISEYSVETLSEFQGKEPKTFLPIDFPEIGKTDADIFENNLLEVMQFVMNHVDFDPSNDLDKAVLTAYKPLGIEPGKTFDANTTVKLDGKKFRAIADKIKAENLALLLDTNAVKRIGSKQFQPKGETTLESLIAVSIIGPIGQPMQEAMYNPVTSDDGTVLNAMNDYVIKMTKDELPPSNAFWSLTLYDLERGFFIPNDSFKYSVGKNAGYKLNDEGGIEIYIAAEKPEGVPKENWLPINRQDQQLDILLRNYVPNLEKMKTWQAPKAVKLN